MPQPPQPPRRRVTDRERRRWPDSALDQLEERTDDSIEDIRRRLNDQRRDITEMRVEMREEAQRNAEFRKESRAHWVRNHREHESVQTTADEIKRTVEPTRWSKVKDFATFISVLIVPFLLTYLTIVLAGGAR